MKRYQTYVNHIFQASLSEDMNPQCNDKTSYYTHFWNF